MDHSRKVGKHNKHKPLTKYQQEIKEIQADLLRQKREAERKEALERPAKRAAFQARRTEKNKEKHKDKKKHNHQIVMTDELIEELTSKNEYITLKDGSRRVLTCSICYPGPSLLHPNDVEKHLNSKVYYATFIPTFLFCLES